MKIFVLGAAGMLGHKVFQRLQPRFPEVYGAINGTLHERRLTGIDFFKTSSIIENVDAADWKSLSSLLAQLRPQVIVNCVGIIKQREDAGAAAPCIEINALLPHRLAELCRGWAGRLIHFSTDCVFSGKTGGYTEDSVPDPTDLYGRTKYLGEVAAENALILRTSMIGRELSHFDSLLEWFLAQNRRQIRGFRRAFYSGLTTNQLADLVGDLIERRPELAGLYQATGRAVSKYELLCMLREAYALDIEIVPDDSFFCDRSMKGDKFHHATGYLPPTWQTLVKDLAMDPTPYDVWRRQ
jgi:dTDP-4-dehydrorhamnose reductase